jgi:competence protein ComEA
MTPLRSALSGFRRPHLVIVAGIVALGIMLAGWAVLRARPVAVAVTPPPVAAPRAGSAESGPATGASPSPTAPPVVVHVLGAVRRPGLVTLEAGSRVQDALDAAGGLTGKADPGELNLAQSVADGQQIVVGTKGKPTGEVRDGAGSAGGSGSSAGSVPGGGSSGGAGQPVNLNTASQAQLEELPGVGPVMAGKIIAWRTEHGRFSRIEELQEIDGVGPKTYAKLAPLCRV